MLVPCYLIQTIRLQMLIDRIEVEVFGSGNHRLKIVGHNWVFGMDWDSLVQF